MGRASSFWHSRSRRRAASAPATPRPAAAAEPEPPVGCMSMVHYLIFTPGAGCVGRPPAGVGVGVASSASASGVVTPHGLHRGSGGDGESSKSGFEAPRNSLDLDGDGDFRIGVQIEPVFDALAARAAGGGGCARRGGGKGGRPAAAHTAPSSEAATPRTPSLVARLMGIDGLPDDDDDLLLSPAPGKQHQNHKKPTTGSSSKKNAVFDNSNKENASTTTTTPAGTAASSSKEKKKRVIPESMTRRDREPLRSLSCNVPAAGQQQSRSLPDTPRASTSASARASWDGPRLSLQALRDNVLDRAAQYMSMPSSPTSSAAAAAKKKEKKDGGRRRRGETTERAAKEHAREILRQAKETVASRKTCSNSKQHSSSSNKENVLMSPARVPDMEEDKLVVVVHGSSCSRPMQAPPPCAANKPGGNPQSSQRQSPSPSPVRVPLAPRPPQQQQAPAPPQRAKPSRPPPPPPPLDPPPTRARRPDGCERFATRIKKPGAGGGPAPTPSASPCAPPTATTAVPLEEDPEYSYLRKVLERGGFMRPPPCRRPARAAALNLKQQPPAAWPPVDPIVFHLLELELPAAEERALGPLRHRWNRKLLFHAAQEVLAGLLLAPDAASSSSSSCTGPALLARVWATVRGFPGADCRVVGDIDALVAADLAREPPPSSARHPAVADAARGVADAVAERVLDALLAECVGGTCGGGEVAVAA
ncbi:hypothetical protein BS78_06G006600 [Paspalum vaginatum]|nr:hypothetical protein BS78_06G006600 [Paspalum vaginatum]